MKKLFVFMFALSLGLCITSCKQKSGEAAPAETEQAEAEQQQDPVEVMKALIEKAKADGVNWSVDEWKDVYKQALVAMKPMLNELGALTSSVDAKSDPSKIAEMMEKAKKLEEQYKPLQDAMEEFEAIAKGTENGKAVNDDEEWGKSTMKELGINFDL